MGGAGCGAGGDAHSTQSESDTIADHPLSCDPDNHFHFSLQLNCTSLSEKSLARVLFFGGMCAFVVWCRSGAAAVQVLVLFLLGAGVRIKFGTFNQPRPLPSPIRRTIGGVALATAPGPFQRSRIISTGCLFVFLCCPSPTSPARINIVARGPVGAGCWQSYDLAWRLALL